MPQALGFTSGGQCKVSFQIHYIQGLLLPHFWRWAGVGVGCQGLLSYCSSAAQALPIQPSLLWCPSGGTLPSVPHKKGTSYSTTKILGQERTRLTWGTRNTFVEYKALDLSLKESIEPCVLTEITRRGNRVSRVVNVGQIGVYWEKANMAAWL